MDIRTPLLFAGIPLALTAALAACGSSSPTSTASATGAPSTATPSTPAATAPADGTSSLTCPSVSTVNAGLGVTAGSPTSDPAGDLPAGSTGVTCTYSDGATGDVVVIVIVNGPVATSFVSRVEAGEQSSTQAQGETFAATDASGVGNQAAIVTVSKGGGPTENGILAASATVGVSVTVIPPASTSQLESFASQLLG